MQRMPPSWVEKVQSHTMAEKPEPNPAGSNVVSVVSASVIVPPVAWMAMVLSLPVETVSRGVAVKLVSLSRFRMS